MAQRRISRLHIIRCTLLNKLPQRREGKVYSGAQTKVWPHTMLGVDVGSIEVSCLFVWRFIHIIFAKNNGHTSYGKCKVQWKWRKGYSGAQTKVWPRPPAWHSDLIFLYPVVEAIALCRCMQSSVIKSFRSTFVNWAGAWMALGMDGAGHGWRWAWIALLVDQSLLSDHKVPFSFPGGSAEI